MEIVIGILSYFAIIFSFKWCKTVSKVISGLSERFGRYVHVPCSRPSTLIPFY